MDYMPVIFLWSIAAGSSHAIFSADGVRDSRSVKGGVCLMRLPDAVDVEMGVRKTRACWPSWW
eukprot:9482042-Pyramimonas_sp.AAC.1